MPALADLGGDDQIVAAAPPGQPAADDRLRFAAFTAVGPLWVGIGGIDEVPARAGISVEDREGCFLVGGPAEHVAAQAERKHLQVCVTDPLHGRASCGPGDSWPPTLRVPEHGNAEVRGRRAASYECLLVPLAVDRMPGVLAGSGVPYVEGVVAAGEMDSQPVPGLEPVTGVPQ